MKGLVAKKCLIQIDFEMKQKVSKHLSEKEELK